jgi:hypothetical protein
MLNETNACVFIPDFTWKWYEKSVSSKGDNWYINMHI